VASRPAGNVSVLARELWALQYGQRKEGCRTLAPFRLHPDMHAFAIVPHARLSRVSITFKDDTSPGVSGRRPSLSLLRPSSTNVLRPTSGQLLPSEASAGPDMDFPCSSDEAFEEDASLGSGTYRELLSKKWLKSGRGGQRSSVQCVTIFRGLKVRMGMHCGITEERDIAFDGLTNRAFYSGELLPVQAGFHASGLASFHPLPKPATAYPHSHPRRSANGPDPRYL
jgi:hypothetical protein